MLGLEGSGYIVASGGGLLAHLMMIFPLRVGFATTGGGSWSEFAIVDADAAIPLPSNVDYDKGASMIVNPLTVVAMLEIAKENHHTTLVHTAASSSLGLMLLRAAPLYNVTIIAVVRGAKNEAILRDFGVVPHLIVRSDAPTFAHDLTEAAKEAGTFK